MGGDAGSLLHGEKLLEGARKLFLCGSRRVAGKDAARLLDDLRQGAVGLALAVGQRAPAQHAPALGLDSTRELESQPRLADSGRAYHRDQLRTQLR